MSQLLIEQKNNQTINTHSDFKPELEKTYGIYKAWKSLPTFLKNPPPGKNGARPTIEEFCEAVGMDDEEYINLCKMRTQIDFAKEYKVSKDTLSLWNTQIKKDPPDGDIRNWANTMTKNVIMSLYNRAVRKGSADEVKLWLQYVNKWAEKQTVEVEHTVVTGFTYKVILPPEYDTSRNRKDNKPEAVRSTGEVAG